MPRTLYRRAITVASRIMTLVYPGFLLCLGLSFILTPTERLAATPVYRTANDHFPLAVYGAFLVCVALGMIGSLAMHLRDFYVFLLAAMMFLMLVLAGTAALSSLYDKASPTAALWPLFVTVAGLATAASLTSKES